MSREANPATTDTPQVLLEHHLKQLRLAQLARSQDERVTMCLILFAAFMREGRLWR